MKKVSFVCMAQEAAEAVGKLRGLGVLHVEHQQAPQGLDLVSLGEDVGLIKDALNVLSEKEFLDRPCHKKHEVTGDWRAIARHIVDSRKRLEQLEEYSAILKNRVVETRPWGDFDPVSVQALAQKNIFIRFYRVPEKEVSCFPSGVIVKIITVEAGIAYCCVLSRQKIEVPFQEVALPSMSLSQISMRLMKDREAMNAIREDIRQWTCYRDSFMKVRQAREKELEFHEALRGMGQADKLVILAGFIPLDTQDQCLDFARKEQWGILINDPADDEIIPTLIRNPKWVSLIQPLLKFLEVLPGYTELDISPLFLIFFSLFFGMLIGDAGYGLVYFLLTFFLQRKFSAKNGDKKIFFLMYILSFCAIAWGVMTGTFFGQAWLVTGGIKALVPALNDPAFIQGLCFFVGALHLSLAHSWRFIVQFPSLPAFAELGWIGILWAAFLLVRTLLLGAVFPVFGTYLIMGGVFLVILFASPQKNIFATIGAGLGALLLSIMNSFGDIVSYVRLFAVGLAGVAISDAFNSMAQGSASSGAFGVVAAGLILVAGHLLNFVLSPMSVLVHGVRLNVLEFSGHAGVTWSGVAYKPLKED